MGLPRSNDGEARFSAYVEGLTSVIGHADRAKPLRDYCLGLMMPCERKSVEPMAAITAPERTAAQHQSLLHFIGEGKWSDERVLAKVRELVLPGMERHGPIEAWIIDDTGFPKKGQHSVGVARQYCGELGKQDNCQVAVTLSIANHDASLPVAYRLYLPKEWASDRKRRRKVGVPDEISFKTKPEIALAQIRWACEAGLPRGAVLMDAGYGVDTDLRTSITALGLSYVAGIQSHTTVWASGTGPRPLQAAARTIGQPILVVTVETEGDIDAAFARLVQQRAGAILVNTDAFLFSRRDQLIALAKRYTVPAIFDRREFAAAGGLMSYGGSVTDAYRLADVYTGRILNGEKPANLPVQQATKVELIINLKTAKALGVTFPLDLLGRADEVIE